MTFNMNGNNNDPNYRYTLPMFQVTIGGSGNGIYTIFTNIENISKQMNHPSEVILKYIASITGSSYIQERNTITGIHTAEGLENKILEYIKYLVICPKCGIPETKPELCGTKKNITINLRCFACKSISEVKGINKQISKGIDIIIKYIKSGGIWIISKGTTVKQINETLETPETNETPEASYNYNPFDNI